MSGQIMLGEASWWLVRVGQNVLWARLQVLPAGTALVIDSDGQQLVYDSEDSARAALMDAEYRLFDGLDADDAAALGLDLDSLQPPSGDTPEAVLGAMVQSVPARQ